MKPVAYHRLATNELIDSAAFYEGRVATLGTTFLSAVETALKGIQLHPARGTPGKAGTRSVKTRRFPFRVIYLDQPDQLWIVAVAHLSR